MGKEIFVVIIAGAFPTFVSFITAQDIIAYSAIKATRAAKNGRQLSQTKP